MDPLYQYETRVCTLEQSAALCNAMAAEGWRVIHVHDMPYGNGYQLMFERANPRVMSERTR